MSEINENIPIYITGNARIKYLQRYARTGYLSPTGQFYECKNTEKDSFCKEIVYRYYFDRYKKLNGSVFYEKPDSMLQEDYYLLKYEHFIYIETGPISIFLEDQNTYAEFQSFYLYYYNLTEAQTNYINNLQEDIDYHQNSSYEENLESKTFEIPVEQTIEI